MDYSAALRAQGILVVVDGTPVWNGDGLDRDGLIERGGGVVDLRLLYGGIRYVVQCTVAIDEGDLPLAAAPVIVVSALSAVTDPNTFRLRAYDPADLQAPLTTWSAFVTVFSSPLETGNQTAVAP